MLKKTIAFIVGILFFIIPFKANSETIVSLLDNKNDFEAFVVNRLQLKCKINKDKGNNRYYLEIYGNCKKEKQSSTLSITGPLIAPNFSKFIFESIDNSVLNEFSLKSKIKVSFIMCNKLYSQELKKSDWDYDGNFHLYWNVDFKDVVFSKPLKVTLTGTLNTKNSSIKEVKIFDCSR